MRLRHFLSLTKHTDIILHIFHPGLLDMVLKILCTPIYVAFIKSEAKCVSGLVRKRVILGLDEPTATHKNPSFLPSFILGNTIL